MKKLNPFFYIITSVITVVSIFSKNHPFDNWIFSVTIIIVNLFCLNVFLQNKDSN